MKTEKVKLSEEIIMLQVKYISHIFLVLLVIIFVSFFVYGITNKTPYSLDYSIPIAKSIISGEFWHLHSDNPFMYFPGSSYGILSLFIFLHIPLNLFGLLSWVCLFIVCKKLGETFGLNSAVAIIFAASVCMTTSVIRTIGDQSIDKWLCTWFIFSVILLERPQRSLRYFLLLGLTLGMLIGTKYSGPLFFLPLLIVYLRPLLRFLNPLRFLAATASFTIFGLFWYIRNFILKGNPYYPANLPFFKGVPGYTQQSWFVWRIPLEYPQDILPMLNAFLSEYMIWAFACVVIVWFVIHTYRKKQGFESKMLRVLFLSLLCGLVSLLLPIIPPQKVALFHIISDMRYVFIYVVMLILAVFMIADKYKENSLLASISLVNAVPIFSFILYQPKIFVISILVVILLHFKRLAFFRDGL